MDPLIKSQLLYQLSYAPIDVVAVHGRRIVVANLSRDVQSLTEFSPYEVRAPCR